MTHVAVSAAEVVALAEELHGLRRRPLSRKASAERRDGEDAIGIGDND